MSPDAFARLRNHPDFRAAVEAHCRGNLAFYAGLDVMQRWLISDLGRGALSASMLILDSIFGNVSARILVTSAVENGACSRGRALAYLKRGELDGMFTAPPAASAMDRVYRLERRFVDAMLPQARITLGTVARLAPEAAEAAKAAGDPAFLRGLLANLGMLSASRRDLFVGPEMPITLFLNRDGGMRMLEQLILSQPPDRSRMLERTTASRTAMARSAFTSRQHVRRLIEDGVARGQMETDGRGVTVSAALSDDVERHYSMVLEIARTAALTTERGQPPAPSRLGEP